MNDYIPDPDENIDNRINEEEEEEEEDIDPQIIEGDQFQSLREQFQFNKNNLNKI